MALPKAGVELIADGLAAFTSDMGKANAAVSGFADQGAKSGGLFHKGFNEVIIGGLREVGAGAVDLLAKGGQALAGFLADSVKVAGDFESGMNDFKVAAGGALDAAGLKTEDFSKLFIQLGKDLPVSTREVQDAAIELVKGGLDPAVVVAGGLKSSLQFAAAAGMGLADAAEVGIKMLGTFVPITATAAEKTTFLAKSQDLLVKAAGASTLNVDKLSDAMLQAGGQARAMGLNYEDFVTTMGAISPSFGSAAEAGTSFKNFLARLIPTTTKAKDMMIDLGLMTEEGANKFFDAQGKYVGGAQAAGLLKNALNGLTDQQRMLALQTIFGNDAMGAATSLAGLGAEGYAAFAETMANANGVTATAEGRQQGLNFAMTNLKGTLEALQIVIGTKVLPMLTPLITLTNDLLGSVLAFTQSVFNASDPLLAFASVIGGVSQPLSNIAFYLIDLTRHGADLNGWLTETPPLFQGFVGVIQTVASTLAPVITDFKEGFGQNGIAGVVDVAIAKLSDISPAFAIVVGVIQASIPTVQLIIDAFADMATRSEITTGTVISAFQTAHALVGGAVSAILKTVQDVFGVIGEYVPGIMRSIEKIIGSVLDQIAVFWRNNGADIMAFVEKAWSSISKIITGIVEIIMILVGTFLAKVSEWFSKYHTEIQFVVQGAWDIISGIIKGVLAIILGAVNTTLALLKGDFSGAWDAIVQMSKDFVLALDQIVGGLLEVMIGVGMDIVNGIKQGVAALWDKFTDWIHDKIMEIPEGIRNALGISSPSKVFAEIGAWSAKGLMVGWQDALRSERIGGAFSLATQAPPASASQIMSRGQGSATTYNQQRTINIPVTTNLTPSAIGQSLAIAGALLT